MATGASRTLTEIEIVGVGGSTTATTAGATLTAVPPQRFSVGPGAASSS